MVLGRFVEGLLGYTIVTCTYWLLATVGTTHLQKSRWTLIAYLFYIMMTAGLTYLSLFDKGGPYYWRLMSLFPCLVGVVGMILIHGPGGGVNHTGFLIEAYGLEVAQKKLNQIFTKDMAS